LLWNGSLETTFGRAKDIARGAEKILTIAINTYEDVIKVEKEVTNNKGVKQKKMVLADGKDKLAARRRIMGLVYDLHEVKTKIFNELAPHYAKRIKEVGQGGGYTRVLRTGARRGDNAEMAIIELV
jgi:large subunit ribosomal protein L17